MSATIVAEGLEGLAHYFEQAPDLTAQAARLALNDTARKGGMQLIKTAILEQVEFPAGYLTGDKLYVSKPAQNNDLEVRITARQRATSLARFALERTPAATRGRGVHVHVSAKGGGRFMKSAFLVRLRAGATISDTGFNLGLAVRLKPGERVFNKREQSSIQLGHNLYLLYGPSVDQVFREVAADETPQILNLVETEFLRQFARLSDAA